MKCCVEGCHREARYVESGLCQTHYHRMWRNGTLELKPVSRKYRRSNPAGYQQIYVGDHPLGHHNGYIYEHRKVVFDKYGWNLPSCEICGNDVNWETCHVDHIDKDVTNNSADNLRAICRGCNTSRTERSTIKKYEMDGEVLSITEWSKKPGVQVGRSQLKARIEKGMSIKDALFSPAVTHKK